LAVGQICNPTVSITINKYSPSKGFFFSEFKKYHGKKNILNAMPEIQHIRLYGIKDDMLFVTPDIYQEAHIKKLL
jgi:hypothetical protein